MISSAYTEAESPLVIAEHNISPLTERQITLFRNGNGSVLEEGKDYEVEEETGASGMKYIYRIDPAAFSKEGRYSILLESVDETGNHNSSAGRFTTGAGYSPSWAIDRTPPSVRISGVDTQQSKFIADSVPLRLIPADNMELSGLRIEIADDRGDVLESHEFAGEELKRIMEENGGEVPFEIPARREWQTLRVSATDGAGNRCSGLSGLRGSSVHSGASGLGENEGVIDAAGYRVLVSSNLMVHLYSSGILPALAFLGLILAIRFSYSVYKHTLA